MFIVRCVYFNNGSFEIDQSSLRVFSNRFRADGYAKELRRSLNDHWRVQVADIRGVFFRDVV